MYDLSVIIPVFNEEQNIPILYKRITNILNAQSYVYELIFVDDGSSDNSLSLLKNICLQDSHLKYISLNRNFGHQSALYAGLFYAQGSAVVTMDADLQDPPEIIPEMLNKWKEGFDVVYARRMNYRNDNLIKKLASYLYYKSLSKFAKVRIPQNVGDFRLIDKKIVNEIKRLKENAGYLRGLIAWMGYRHTFIDYKRGDRQYGKAGYNFPKLLQLGMNGILSFSLLPLKLGLIIGVISIIIGVAFLLFMFLDIIINGVYYHLYKFLVDIIFIFMGILFILIWIIGEYVGKIHNSAMGMPPFIIKEKENLE